MIYQTILFSFCLIGMVSAANYCKYADGKTEVTCKAVEGKPCTFKTDNKVVASTDTKIQPESTYKDKAKAKVEKGVCKLELDHSVSGILKINCSADSLTVETIDISKEAEPCSASAALQYAGVSLLLTLLITSLLSEVL